MVGNFEDENNKGIIPRTFTHIFDSIKNDKDNSYTINISFIQIYLESVKLIFRLIIKLNTLIDPRLIGA
jgi:hypothetical protein